MVANNTENSFVKQQLQYFLEKYVPALEYFLQIKNGFNYHTRSQLDTSLNYAFDEVDQCGTSPIIMFMP